MMPTLRDSGSVSLTEAAGWGGYDHLITERSMKRDHTDDLALL